MKAKLFTALIIIPVLFLSYSDANTKKNIPVIEEEKTFWDSLLNEKDINNKNLLYASYIAYKDRLNDLSIETFQECIKTNPSNSIVSGISAYYIGKNLYLAGKYEEAITQFLLVENYDLAAYNYIKFAATLNMAIAYYNSGNNEKFRENVQKVISNDIVGNYKKKALDMLSMAQ